mmetsp:Transcript_4700/g.14896  ORF Transcript_4700/g.14896 Transcript_4700/m.14896 type:complete len:239 (+) Transcript_4700:203-919(+)
MAPTQARPPLAPPPSLRRVSPPRPLSNSRPLPNCILARHSPFEPKIGTMHRLRRAVTRSLLIPTRSCSLVRERLCCRGRCPSRPCRSLRACAPRSRRPEFCTATPLSTAPRTRVLPSRPWRAPCSLSELRFAPELRSWGATLPIAFPSPSCPARKSPGGRERSPPSGHGTPAVPPSHGRSASALPPSAWISSASVAAPCTAATTQVVTAPSRRCPSSPSSSPSCFRGCGHALSSLDSA